MDLSDASSRLARGRSILFSPDSPCLRELSGRLSSADRRTVVLWALDNAGRVAAELGASHPEDPRPAVAVSASTSWSMGYVKMPIARRAILDVHAMAREMPDPTDAALCHAVGQGCSCVHTPGHAMGLPVYELTAAYLRDGGDSSPIERIVDIYLDSLYVAVSDVGRPRRWAGFLS